MKYIVYFSMIIHDNDLIGTAQVEFNILTNEGGTWDKSKGCPQMWRMKYLFNLTSKTPKSWGKVDFKQELEYYQNSPIANIL